MRRASPDAKRAAFMPTRSSFPRQSCLARTLPAVQRYRHRVVSSRRTKADTNRTSFHSFAVTAQGLRVDCELRLGHRFCGLMKLKYLNSIDVWLGRHKLLL